MEILKKIIYLNNKLINVLLNKLYIPLIIYVYIFELYLITI